MKTILGYQPSNGDSICDYLVEEIGHEGYIELCKESLKFINNELELQINSACSNDDELQALIELGNSLTKTINGEQPTRSIKLEEGIQYLHHCKVLSIRALAVNTKQPKKYRNKVTEYKDIWRRKMPLNSYVGLFKLAPGKFKAIIDGCDHHINWEDPDFYLQNL